MVTYRKLTWYLHEEDIKHQSHPLQSEKNLKVIFKGVPEKMGNSTIAEKLRRPGFYPVKVGEMTAIKKKKEVRLPKVMVEVPRKDKGIYKMQELYGLMIRVEKLRRPKEVDQCYR